MERFPLEPVELIDTEIDAVAGGAGAAAAAAFGVTTAALAGNSVSILIPVTVPPVSITGGTVAVSIGVD